MTDDTMGRFGLSRRTLLRGGLGGAAALALGAPAVRAAPREVKISMQRSSVLFTVLKVKGTLAERLARWASRRPGTCSPASSSR